MKDRRARTLSWVLSVATLFAVVGFGSGGPSAHAPPGDQAAAPHGTWIGPLQGSRAFVAIVADGEQVAAYVCDTGRIGSWFFGSAGSGERLQLTGREGALLEVTLGDRAAGRFTKDGRSHTFEARATDKTVLFRADAVAGSAAVVGGWIQNGSESRGSLSVGSTIQPAPTLAPNLTVPSTQIPLVPAPMTPDTLSQPTANTTKFVWGAAGDSFASGEGNPEIGISDPQKVEDFAGLRWGNDSSITVPISGVSLAADVTTCHRSDEAGAPKAQRDLQAIYSGMSFALGFVACSGAATTNLLNAGYTGPNTTEPSLLGRARVTQPAQLDRISQFKTAQGRLDALYMSIGGNDAGFGDIITDCISPTGPGNCATKWDSQLNRNLGTLATNYRNVESRIVSLFGDQLPVLISEYPNPLDNGSTSNPPVCQGPDYDAFGEVGVGGFDDALQDNVTAEEATFAFTIAPRLDAAVAAAASAHGWTHVFSHVATFAGHGVCTAQPFARLNSRALRRQGRDVPDTSVFLFSSGFMHPNNTGYRRYADAIRVALQPFVDGVARTGLAVPVNVRIAAATRNGPITLRWADRSTSENAYEVEVLPARLEDAARIVVPAGAVAVTGGGFRQRLLGTGTQQFVHEVSGAGRFLYRVRGCQTGIRFLEGLGPEFQCGAYSARITGTNVAPAQPTGLRFTTQSFVDPPRLQLVDVFTWSAQADAIEYVVRVEASDGTAVETRTMATMFSQRTIDGAQYKVAACNRIACSGYATP